MDKLIELLHKNFEDYKKDLLTNSKEVIFDKSYETAIKYEMCEFCDFKFSDDVLRELLSQDNPLKFLYQEYIHNDAVNIINELQILFEDMR